MKIKLLFILLCGSVAIQAAHIVEIINTSSFPVAFQSNVVWPTGNPTVITRSGNYTQWLGTQQFTLAPGEKVGAYVYIGWQEASGLQKDEKLSFLSGSGKSLNSGFIQETSFLSMNLDDQKRLAHALVFPGVVAGAIWGLAGGPLGSAALSLAGGYIGLGIAKLSIEGTRVRFVSITQKTTRDLAEFEAKQATGTHNFYDPVIFGVGPKEDTFRLIIKDVGPDDIGPVRTLFQLERA